MRVVHIASEVAPFAKVGGLADVVYSLSKSSAKENIGISVIIPLYGSIPEQILSQLKIYKKNLIVHYDKDQITNDIYLLNLEGFKIFLISPHKPIDFFSKNNIYGYKNDPDRFLYFSKAALEFLFQEKQPIDVIQLHDWHTAIIPILCEDMYKPKGLAVKKTILTIHNIGYQGHCKPNALDKIGLKGKDYLIPTKLQDPRLGKHKQINLMKGGIIYSSFITTVSPSYADEILYKESGAHLDGVLRAHQHKLKGILNGIDTEYWNPHTDPFIQAKYSKEDSVENLVAAKQKNKKILQEKTSLINKDTLLVACVGRLVTQKGPKLVLHALYQSLKHQGQFALLGSLFDKRFTSLFFKAQKKLKDNNNTFLSFEYNEALAHLIFAAADFFVVPSLFEPCGLTQMLAMRYGTIPIVRNTGGLKDTVFDIDYSNQPSEKRNGYTFENFDQQGLDSALNRAFHDWNHNRKKIYQLMYKNMQIDHSWKASLQEYMKLYNASMDLD